MSSFFDSPEFVNNEEIIATGTFPFAAIFNPPQGSKVFGTWSVEKFNPNTYATNTAQSVSGGATRTITRPSGWTDWVALI